MEPKDKMSVLPGSGTLFLHVTSSSKLVHYHKDFSWNFLSEVEFEIESGGLSSPPDRSSTGVKHGVSVLLFRSPTSKLFYGPAQSQLLLYASVM